MRDLNHPCFIRVYKWYDMMVSLRCEAVLMDLAGGDTFDLVEQGRANPGSAGDRREYSGWAPGSAQG